MANTNGSLVDRTVVRLTTSKVKPLTLTVLGFDLSSVTNTFILIIFYDFCLLPALFCAVRKIIYK